MSLKHKYDYYQLKSLSLNLEKANKKIADAFKSAHKLYDVKQSSFDVLYALLHAPEHTLTPSELLKQTHITSGSLTSRVDKLLSNELVEKNKSKTDKRVRTIRLTKKGHSLIIDILDHHHHHLESVFSSLKPKQCEKLNHLLELWLQENAKTDNSRLS